MTETRFRDVVLGTAPSFRRCLVIGEIAQSHDGSLGQAHAFIDAIANAGADAVKFQTHIASEESTPREPWRVRFSKQDDTRFDYWKRMEFTPDQWRGLKEHADERGLLFLSSPFSLAAVDLLAGIGMKAWKIASGEVSNPVLLDAIGEKGAPIMLSTGMSTFAEIDKTVDRIRGYSVPFAVMQCTTAYPCPPQKVGLNVIDELRRRYDTAVGLSDHSGTIFPGLAAATLESDVLELHVAFSREMFGPDVPASVTTSELAELVRGIRFIEESLANPVDKDAFAKQAATLRTTFGKSVVAATALEAGTVLGRTNLTVKKPGDGLPPERLPELIGKRLVRTVAADEVILEADVE